MNKQKSKKYIEQVKMDKARKDDIIETAYVAPCDDC